jgi:hypothetical protein
VSTHKSVSVRTCAAITCVALVAACTTRSQLRLSHTAIPELRDGPCAEQRSRDPIVSCYEYTTLAPAGGVALGLAGYGLGALLMVVAFREFAAGLGSANDH